MQGSLDVPEASQLLSISLDDSHDTIGGVVVAALGRLPRKGDTVRIEGYDATVVGTGRGRSVGRVLFTPREETPPNND